MTFSHHTAAAVANCGNRIAARRRIAVPMVLLCWLLAAAAAAEQPPLVFSDGAQEETLPAPPTPARPAPQQPPVPSITAPALRSDPFQGVFEYLDSSQAAHQQQLEQLRRHLERLERALEAQDAAREMLPSASHPSPHAHLGPPVPVRPPQPPAVAVDPPVSLPIDPPAPVETSPEPQPIIDHGSDPPATVAQHPAMEPDAERSIENSADGAPSTVPVSTSPIPITDQAIDRAALADNLFGAGRIELALSLYAELLAESKDPRESAWYEYQLGTSCRRQGNFSEAAKYYRRVAGSTADPQLAQHARWWLSNLEKQQKLRDQLQRLQQTFQRIEKELP